jgi:FkbM family methyltransferase
VTTSHRRGPSKTDSLHYIRDTGIEIDWILDVGILNQTPELISTFPDTKQYLFEPVFDFYDTIHKRYEGLNYELIEAAVCDEDKTTLWLKTWSIKESQAITHSSITDTEEEGATPICGLSLQAFAHERGLTGRGLVKIDIDGEELRVLRGMENIVDMVDIVVIESPMIHFADRFAALTQMGYELFDICDLCYYEDQLIQADLIFTKPDLARGVLKSHKSGRIDGSRWRKYPD